MLTGTLSLASVWGLGLSVASATLMNSFVLKPELITL